MDWFDLAVQGLSSITSLALSLLHGPTLKSIHDYWKSHSFLYRDFSSKVMSLLFNMLSWFVIGFLTLRKGCFPAQDTSLKLSSYPESRKSDSVLLMCRH